MASHRHATAPGVWLLLLLIAAAINAGFLLLMERMVARDGVRTVNVIDAEPVEFVRTAVEEQTRSKDRRRAPPPKPMQVERHSVRMERSEATSLHDLPMPDAAFSVSSLLDLGGGGLAGAVIGERLVEGQSNGGRVDMASVGVNDLVPLVVLPPQYPPGALMRGIRGHVTVSFVVDGNGLVEQVDVLEADPEGVFEEAAVQAVQRWRFRPYRRDGQALRVMTRTRIVFDRQPEEGEVQR